MRLINKVLGQRRVPFLGEIVDSVFTALPALSVYTFASVTVLLYETVKKYFIDWAPWMNVGYFILFLGVGFCPILLFTFKYVIPSVWHFRSTQMSHLEKKVDAMDRKLDKLLKERDANSGS